MQPAISRLQRRYVYAASRRMVVQQDFIAMSYSRSAQKIENTENSQKRL
jgi:hypothetical protein